MFRYLRVKSKPEIIVPTASSLTLESLARDSQAPIRLGQLTTLPEKALQRLARGLIPVHRLTEYGIDPITLLDSEGNQLVWVKTKPDAGVIQVSARKSTLPDDEFFHLELADNAYGGIDLNFLVLNNPDSQRYGTDFDRYGNPTLFGTLHRNLEEEERAMRAGLAPGQVRSSLGASSEVLKLLELFLSVLGQRAYFLEPLSYASAWVFERRGFAYVRGHKLMDDIHQEFQPGGRLFNVLDNSTPFRRPDQWNNVRGRAWAIHDGILEAIDARWDKLRMVKQIGKHAGVETFPESVY